MLRVLCIRNGNTSVVNKIAATVRQLNLEGVEVVEVEGTTFQALDAVVGCERLAVIDDAAEAAPHYRQIADAVEAATDMNLGAPAEIVILGAESTQAAPRIIARIRDLATQPNGNRRDSSLCHTD